MRSARCRAQLPQSTRRLRFFGSSWLSSSCLGRRYCITRNALLGKPRAGGSGLGFDRITVGGVERLHRVARGELAHERRVNRIAEHFLQAIRHGTCDLPRNTQEEILLLARPRLAILVG